MYQLFNPYQNTRLVEWSVCKQRLPTCSWLIVKGSYYPINETKLMRQRENSGTTYCNMWETDIGVWKSYNTSQAMGPIQICGCPFYEPRVSEIVHIYTYICKHMYMYMYVYTYIYIYLYTIYNNMYIYIYMYTRTVDIYKANYFVSLWDYRIAESTKLGLSSSPAMIGRCAVYYSPHIGTN